MRGPSTPDVEDEQWCARRLLARIHAYTQNRLRREIEPVTAQELVRFLLRWQHVAPGTQRQGRAGVLAVVDQLQGFEIPAGAWEEAVLPARVEGYQHRWLEDLCHAGRARLGPPRPRGPPMPRAPTAPGIGHAVAGDTGHLRPARGPPVAPASGTRRRRARRSPPTGRRATCSTPCGPGGPCSTRSCAAPPGACPSRWRKGCGTWWRGASSPPTGSRPCARCSRPARRGTGASATSRGCVPARARSPHAGARAARAAGRCCPTRRAEDEVDRDDAGRAGGRAAAGPLGRRLLGSHGAREPGPAVARGGVGAAEARGARPGARRSLRHGAGRRAVRAARSRRGAAPRAPHRARRTDRPAQRGRPPQPGGDHPPRRARHGGADELDHLPRRPARSRRAHPDTAPGAPGRPGRPRLEHRRARCPGPPRPPRSWLPCGSKPSLSGARWSARAWATCEPGRRPEALASGIEPGAAVVLAGISGRARSRPRTRRDRRGHLGARPRGRRAVPVGRRCRRGGDRAARVGTTACTSGPSCRRRPSSTASAGPSSPAAARWRSTWNRRGWRGALAEHRLVIVRLVADTAGNFVVGLVKGLVALRHVRPAVERWPGTTS